MSPLGVWPSQQHPYTFRLQSFWGRPPERGNRKFIERLRGDFFPWIVRLTKWPSNLLRLLSRECQSRSVWYHGSRYFVCFCNDQGVKQTWQIELCKLLVFITRAFQGKRLRWNSAWLLLFCFFFFGSVTNRTQACKAQTWHGCATWLVHIL